PQQGPRQRLWQRSQQESWQGPWQRSQGPWQSYNKRQHNYNNSGNHNPDGLNHRYNNCNKIAWLPNNNNEVQLVIQSSNNNKAQLYNSEITQFDNNIQSDNSIEIIYLEDQTTISTKYSTQILAPPFVGQTFNTWEYADKYLNDYVWRENFVIIKLRNNQDFSPEKVCRQHTYACDHQGNYVPKKSKAAIVSIISLSLKHNHLLNSITNSYATKNQILPKAVIQEIHFYMAQGNLSAIIQHRFLSAKFPEITIYPRDLQNLIQKYKVTNYEENDISKLLRQLLTKKAEEPG
ncbi:5436_t:CDS:2, partial [Racocetra persica]